MRIITLSLIIVLLLSFIAYAQAEVDADDIKEAGITPDSKLWGLELAYDKITELFNSNLKLQHARERIAEVKVMVAQNKIFEADSARVEFNKKYAGISTEKQDLLKPDKVFADNLGQKISAIAKIGKLTPEDQTAIKQLITEHKNQVKQSKNKAFKP